MSIPRVSNAIFWQFFFILFAGCLAWGQANVDETQETVSIYVDATAGSDSNPGSKQLPLKTIAAAADVAVSNNQAGIGTKVVVNPGTYRESISLRAKQKDTSMPITFQAKTKGTAIISGADVWTGWAAYSGNSNIYTHHWGNKWGMCPVDDDGLVPEEDILRRQEMIMVNGTSLAQVLSLSAMRQSTFYVDEKKKTAYVWPMSGTNMGTATVEVATRSSLLFVSGKSNMVFRGLTFQYANSCRADSAVALQGAATNILFDKDSFLWNNATGIKITSSFNTTVQKSVANYNGIDGMKGLETKYDLWQDIQARYNGWRGAQGVYYNTGVAGMHFVKGHNQTLKNVDSSFNLTFGFHWDTDHQNVTADALLASENLLANGFIEKNQGPMTVSNSYFCSGDPYTGPNNLGFELRNSENITLTGNTILNNVSQIQIIGDAGGIPITNWETGEDYNLITQRITFTNNIIVGATAQRLFNDGKLNGSDWHKFQKSLTSDYNTWWNASETEMFYVPVPEIWTKLDMTEWKALTLTDQHSSWTSPSDPGAACKVKAATKDFWFVMDAFSGYQTVGQGSPATWAPNVVSLKFTGTVTLDSDGVQNIPGAKGTWSPNTIVNSGTSTFTVTTTGATPKGTYPITFIATSGNITKTATVSLIVQ